MKLRTLALSLALGASLILGGSGSAQAQNTSCSVPPLSYQQANPVTVVLHNGQPVSFATAALSNVPAGYIVTNGNYLAWCVEYDALIREDYPLNPTLYLSTDPALPAELQSPNWDMVNYILNHKQGTAIDVQNAIWHFIGGPVDPADPDGYYPPSATALALIADATANGEGFVPGPGQVVAVVLNIPDVEGFYDYQVMIIEASCNQVPVTGCVGDFVWLDKNSNGIQDADEPGVKDVVVKILDCAGNVLASTLTDANGYYLFSNVPAGSYRIKFTLPGGHAFTTQDAGSDDAKDSDADGSGLTACFTLGAGECNYTLDAGLRKLLRFATYTQGGWGAVPKGNNPGAILSRNWTTVYGSSALVIGGNYTMKFSSPSAITGYLPAGGTPGVLKKNYTNPTSTEAGVFGGQVTALRLNVDFSIKGITQPGLASLKIAPGNKFAGYTVAQLLSLAQQVLGGNLSALPAGCSVSDLNNAADRINNNFDGGSMDLGYLVP